MASFTVRVELHQATWTDYESLHVQMEARGFRRTIKSDQGKVYHLPTAEYDISGNVDASGVLERAKAAASATRKSFGVLVSEATSRTWINLPAA